jgi:hypothetical protein
MKERLQSPDHFLEFRCPNHNTMILETVEFCDSCKEQIEVTAGLALVTLERMEIAETDEIEGKMTEGTKKDDGPGKGAGHLIVPVWNTKKVSAFD